ncbi:hypothetical protein [Cyclobacterium amurskyense]|uniref:Uncharacterized protein n=1 Tax=Cyclobacterium amurskyense TaxID=320787 RepID=A0A0H4PGW8_9BACT|nr:hypothetical protein [Cyclobacterium amurskyense]AKP52083.1 hypothetical protein CA2015_2673 [Cyclobacterium amurskyense]
MSTTQYQLVFKIDVNHAYFNGGEEPDLFFNPSVSSNQSFKRLNFVVNGRKGGMDLFARSPFPLVDYLKTIVLETGIEFFDFDILSKDTSFTTYTDFPIDGLGLLKYSSDDKLNHTENEMTVLHPIFESDLYASAIGMVRVSLKDLIATLDAGRSVHFNINFNSRSIQWQYHIINYRGLPLTDISIASDSGIHFSGPTEVVLENNQTAQQFDSNVLIPFRQNPEHSFDLLMGGKIIVKGLPSPSPLGVYPLETDSEKIMVAAMYVNV